MDQRTIGQILANPDWLRQTYAEERPIQQTAPPVADYAPAPAYPYQPAVYPPGALPPPPQVPVRPESPVVEVRGTIAYVAHYRAEYFNPADPSQMMQLAQTVIMGETGAQPGEAPPPWFPDVQFWIQSFERIDPYATAQQEELKRLEYLKAQAAEQARVLDEQQRAEQLRRERLIYGEPGTFSREGTLTGLAVEPARENGWEPGPIPGTRPDWLADVFRELTTAIGGIHERLESLERRDGGAGGAGPALHPDQRPDDDADHRRREQQDRRADRPDPGDGGAAAAYPLDAADAAADGPDHDDGDLPAEPGRADAAAGAGHNPRRTRRPTVEKDA